MREFLLGLRLLSGAGRGNRVRFFLMAVGSSLGVCCLALVLTIPAILDAHDGRTAAREPQTTSAGKAPAGSTLVLQRRDPHGSKPFTRVFVARGDKDTPQPPPGLDALPGPGELFVSPRLHELMRAEPALKGLLPGREKGRIGGAGLGDPDELYAYVGTSRAALAHDPDTGALRSFGSPYAPVPVVEPSTLTNLRFALATLVLLPLAVFLSVCARLSAASRTRRLASLRLLGLSTRGTQRVNAAETVAAALLGAVLGLGEYWLLNQAMSRSGLPALRWYPADGSLSWTTVVVCLLGCPALAWFVGRASARSAATNPLAVRRTAVPKPPSKWGGLLLVTGLGIVSGFCATGLTDHPATSDGIFAVLVVGGVLLTGSGLVLTLPWLSYLLARKVAGTTRSLTLNLAMRRNEVEPGSTMRVVTGLVLLVYAASLAQGVLIEFEQVSKPGNPVQDYSLPLSALSEEQESRLAGVPGVRAHARTMVSWSKPGPAGIPPRATALVATCAQLTRLVRHTEGCREGRVMRLVDPNSSADPDMRPGASFPFELRTGRRHGAVTLTIPSATVVMRPYDPSAIGDASMIVPPTALPAHARPRSGSLVLDSDSEPRVVRGVLDGIGGVAPTVSVEPVGVNVDSLQQIAVIETLLVLGMIMGLVIGVAAFLVAVTDRAVERRAQVTAITLIGARARTLRAVQSTQVVLPLAVGLVLALVTGKLAESSYLVTGGGEVFWDFAGIPVLACAALGVVAVAALGTLPLVGRRIDPELIRRD
ncbi:Predicted ABC-type transport system involved in lysophospholipase L1 biosynthesis, permease component [Streptomyces sp. 1222.5]|uniref:FtsX-like permease family protein n=1 Tax=unclassified Streptomyces TaxID=2593676 RepID=UPI000898FE61|nr:MULTISPECIES: FtsX-like permease family protein [unclassified Streptomyces]PKW07972.1 putative lysophospholipase L1 biosynthesis ABC-type transport system permease subunit [Streptomyces sp. 5112.2]SEC75229.1 Predicted ABC-type transport system involved in lysophospholipase L1 biosynthesis, permease component [Streptomyces sp. 1222.5]